jgi:hypothetical protein
MSIHYLVVGRAKCTDKGSHRPVGSKCSVRFDALISATYLLGATGLNEAVTHVGENNVRRPRPND